jgi:CRP-like cAMP-binding protein
MKTRRRVPLASESIEPEMCTPAMRLQILASLPFFRGLGEREIARIDADFKDTGFEEGEVVVMAGKPVDKLYVVAAGKLVTIHPMPSGQDVLMDVLARGDFFGSLAPADAAAYPDIVRARTSGCLLAISAQQFRRVLEAHPKAALAVLEVTGERLRRAHESIQHLSASTAEVRIAHALLKLADKLGTHSISGILIQTPLSREDLAGMTGTTPETASRVLSRFQRDGWIETGRRWVRLKDPRGLARLAESE